MGRGVPAADVLVVGAGIAGLTAACSLQRRGVPVRVAERAAAPQAATAGIVLHPNALACLRRLGCPAGRAGAVLERHVAADPDGSRTVVEWARVWPGGDLPVAIHRRVLARLLLANLAPGTVCWSSAPREARADEHGVTVAYDDRASERYALVIGADGVNSAVRRSVDPAAVPRFTGHSFIRTTVLGDELPMGQWRTWRAAPYFFGIMTIGGGRLAVFLQVTDGRPLRMPQGQVLPFLRAAAGTMTPEVAEFVAAMRPDEDLVVRPAHRLVTSRTVAGRIALVGDAAHAFSPATAQGGGLAVEDAAVLGEEIARHGCGPVALAAFERRRRPRIERFRRVADQHVTLMDALHGAQPGGHRGPAGAAVDASRWYRRLYAPLFGPP